MSRLIALLLASFSVGLMSCDPPQAGVSSEDDRNPYFRQAGAFLENDLHHAAIKEYKKALDKAGDKVARAHVEIGLIYADKLGDSISAIYHFQQFLDVRPEAPEVDRVKNYIEKAKIDLVLGLPRPPSADEEVILLREENKRLRAELKKRGWQSKFETQALVANVSSDTTQVAANTLDEATTGQNIASGETELGSSASQVYIIKAGDSLWKIAGEFYPEDIPAGVEKIKDANTTATSNVRNLKVGQELLIP
ncbi:MAG: LysM domain-containing protein [Verrucomicrobiota bacterium]